MPNRSFNCCIFNHPCPIFCPSVNLECENQVVNPLLGQGYAFFNNTDVGLIESSAQIPLSPVILGGGTILPSGEGVLLPTGVYEVNYFASGTVPQGETLSIALQLGGTLVEGSQISATTTAGTTTNLTRTIVISVAQSSLLTLQNTTSQAADFSFASLFVRSL